MPDTPVEPQASIVLPLHVMNKVIGVLNLDRLGGKTYTDEEFELVKPFANLAAIAIENASLYEKSQLRAVTDPLTGLYNHGHFQETLEHEVRRCERYGDGFSLLMIDLDHFKRVNDRFGHPRGDARAARGRRDPVATTTREADYAARYGGEEFAIAAAQDLAGRRPPARRPHPCAGARHRGRARRRLSRVGLDRRRRLPRLRPRRQDHAGRGRHGAAVGQAARAQLPCSTTATCAR